MRAAVFGRELLVADNQFIAVNLGYNYYNEHEGNAAMRLKEYLNRETEAYVQRTVKPGLLKMRNVNKKLQEDVVKMQRWKNTPFCTCMLRSSLPVYRREIIINNEPISDKFSKFILVDGEYSLLVLNPMVDFEYWERQYGTKRTFTEGHFFNCNDYQNFNNNMGYIMDVARGRKLNDTTIRAAGTWGEDGAMIFFQDRNIADSFCEALKAGNMALVAQENRILKDRGCCFINLDSAYAPRSNSSRISDMFEM